MAVSLEGRPTSPSAPWPAGFRRARFRALPVPYRPVCRYVPSPCGRPSAPYRGPSRGNPFLRQSARVECLPSLSVPVLREGDPWLTWAGPSKSSANTSLSGFVHRLVGDDGRTFHQRHFVAVGIVADFIHDRPHKDNSP